MAQHDLSVGDPNRRLTIRRGFLACGENLRRMLVSRAEEQRVDDSTTSDSTVSVRFAKELVEQLADWSLPVQCKIVRLESGEHELLSRTVPVGAMLPPAMTDDQVAAIRDAWDEQAGQNYGLALLAEASARVDPPLPSPADTEVRG